jgi:serine/threonine protein kinase
MMHHGRLPPQVVLEIARAMLRELGTLHRQGICHGDVSVSSLILGDDGRVTLAMPGVRGILRPTEGYAHDDLLPEAYDGLAPERVALGTPPTVASDLYACGCVWWHLLCGRSPLAGGSGLSKLRAAQAGEICDVRRYAPDVPVALAGVLVSCLQHDPTQRPASVSQAAAMLGSPTRTGQEALADCLAKTGRPSVPWTTTVRSIRQSNRTPLWIAGAACSLVTLVALAWPLMHRGPLHGERPGMVGDIANASNGNRQKSGQVGNDKTLRNRQNSAQPMTASNTTGNTTGNAVSSSLDPAMQTQAGRSPASYHNAQYDNTPYDNAPPDQEEGAVSNANRVVPTSYQQPAASPKDLVLSGNGPLYLATLSVQPGQRVRGPSGRRVQLVVPRDGLKVDQERVCFENIDFLWQGDSAAEEQQLVKNGRPNAANNRETRSHRETSSPAMVRLMTRQVAFHGCSFQAVGKSASMPVAIAWGHPNLTDQANPDQTNSTQANPIDHEAMALPSGRIQIMDCVFSRVAAGLACHRGGVLGIEVTNSLYTRCGPFMQLDHWPKADESVSVALLQSTMRQSGPVFACQTSDDAYQPGPVVFQATACIFALADGEALLHWNGSNSPEFVQASLGVLRWTGQGSLVTPNTPIAIWMGEDGKKRGLDEASLSIAGLVRSEVGFAGQESQDPASNRAVQWQAPIQTPEAPGIDPSPLPVMLGSR